MILVDTNVWIDHLHRAEPELSELLMSDEICCHDLVLTELALGSLKKRNEFLSALSELKQLPTVDDHEVRWFIEKRKLWGRGLSAVDVHLLASVVVVPGTCAMWHKTWGVGSRMMDDTHPNLCSGQISRWFSLFL